MTLSDEIARAIREVADRRADLAKASRELEELLERARTAEHLVGVGEVRDDPQPTMRTYQ